jgi:hypothetical protein
MPFSRPAFALAQRRFGRGPVRLAGDSASADRRVTEDLKLFAATFVAGFLFVSILIG